MRSLIYVSVCSPWPATPSCFLLQWQHSATQLLSYQLAAVYAIYPKGSNRSKCDICVAQSGHLPESRGRDLHKRSGAGVALDKPAAIQKIPKERQQRQRLGGLVEHVLAYSILLDVVHFLALLG